MKTKLHFLCIVTFLSLTEFLRVTVNPMSMTPLKKKGSKIQDCQVICLILKQGDDATLLYLKSIHAVIQAYIRTNQTAAPIQSAKTL